MISVVIATFNAEPNLQRALDSVFCQTSSEVEVLIADGGSIDGTQEIIKRNSNRVKWWISEKDDGIYDAWNKAITHASGDWIMFLGADDELYDEKVVETFHEQAKSLTDSFDVVYGMVDHTNSMGETWLLAGESWDTFSKSFRFKAQMLPHQGVFHNRKIFERGLKFDSSFKISGDYELLLRVLKNKEAFFLHDFVIAKMEIGGVSSEFNNHNLHYEFMLARKINGYNESIWTILLRTRYFLRSVLIKAVGLEASKKVNALFRLILGKPTLPE